MKDSLSLSAAMFSKVTLHRRTVTISELAKVKGAREILEVCQAND